MGFSDCAISFRHSTQRWRESTPSHSPRAPCGDLPDSFFGRNAWPHERVNWERFSPRGRMDQQFSLLLKKVSNGEGWRLERSRAMNRNWKWREFQDFRLDEKRASLFLAPFFPLSPPSSLPSSLLLLIKLRGFQEMVLNLLWDLLLHPSSQGQNSVLCVVLHSFTSSIVSSECHFSLIWIAFGCYWPAADETKSSSCHDHVE